MVTYSNVPTSSATFKNVTLAQNGVNKNISIISGNTEGKENYP